MENFKGGIGSATGGMAFSAVVVFYVFLSLICSLVCTAAGLAADDAVYIYINYLVAPVAIAIGITLVLKVQKASFRALVPLRMPKKLCAKWCAAAVLLTFGLLFSASWINVGFSLLLGRLGYESTVNYFPPLSGGGVALALLVIAVIPALFEETLFRGVVLGNIREQAGGLNAVFLCGMCFALFHASALQTFYQFVCGCAFALLAIRSRSLIPSVIAHFINNAVIIVLQACGLDTSGTIFDWAPLWAAILVTVLSALSFAASLTMLIVGWSPEKPQKGGISKFFVTAALGIAALVIIWIAGLFA